MSAADDRAAKDAANAAASEIARDPPGVVDADTATAIGKKHLAALRALPPATHEEPRMVPMTKRDPDVRPLRALETTQTVGRLFRAIGDARDAADSVLKGSTATVKTEKGQFSYVYASADHIVAVARDALRGTGVTVIPLDWRTRPSGRVSQNFDVLDRVLRIAHDSGEFIDVELLDWPVLPGAGGRDHAKALGVALTSSLGYFQRDLLGLPRLDSDDMNAQETRSQRHRDRGEPEDQTPAPAVADEPSARGRVVLAKLGEVKDAATLRDRWAWWSDTKAAEETADARRFTPADVRAIDAALGALRERIAEPAAVDEPAPEEPAADPPPASAPVAAPAASPPRANVTTPANAPAATRPAGRSRKGGSGLPGME